jgi:hypothetical protein
VKYAEKIDLFMYAKHIRLLLFGFDGYYEREDSERIRALSGKAAKKVWERLEIVPAGITMQSCAFCIMHCSQCDECGYAIRHMPCGSEASLIFKLVNKYKLQASIILPREFYRKLWNNLNEL